MRDAPNRCLLVGIAGSFNAFSLSLYNLKGYAYADPVVRNEWQIDVIQHSYISIVNREERVAALAERVIEAAPTLVGFSCYMWNVEPFRLLAERIRQALPETLILWGGPEMTTDYVSAGQLDEYEMDFCISGEGEQTFRELLRSLPYDEARLKAIPGLSFRRGKQPFIINERRAPFKSLLEFPSPFLSGVVDDEVLLRENVEANIETQRGCTLRCSYCIYHKDMDRISYSVVDRTLDEVRFVINKGVKHLRFVDANFSSDLDHAKSVMRGLIGLGVEAKLMFELIPGFIDDELASLFAQYNGLHEWNEITIGLGVQTINFSILKKMRRGVRIEKFEATFNLLEKYRLFAKIDLIIGLPGEDLRSIERTLEYMMDKLRNSSAHLLCCHVMRGLPGTELLDIAREHEMVFSSRYDPHELRESPMLPRDQMLKALRRTAVIFRLVNHGGWTNREFLSGYQSDTTDIRDAFFAARDRLRASNMDVIDLVVAGLMAHLRDRESWFVDEDFPYAETWWWSHSKREVEDEWIVEYLNGLGGDRQLAGAAH